MPLPQIQVANGGFDKWIFDHWQDHVEISQAIKAQLGLTLPEWPIFPFTPESPDSWNRMHQSMHSDMLNAIGVSGTDLGQVDWDDPTDVQAFYDLNYQEHSNARQALRI